MGRALLIIAAVLIVGIIAITSGGGDSKPGGDQPDAPETAPAGALEVRVAMSPEKEEMLKDLARRFNEDGKEVNGKKVFVVAEKASSGEAQTQIAKALKGGAGLKPTIWSPSSSLWGRLLNYEADQPIVERDNPSLVKTPLVIAMWEPLAKTLGYPKKPLGFAEILELATSKEGWAKYGKPQYGKFKLGHTNPDFSTSGLSAVAAEYFTAAKKREGLTEADINQPRVRRQIRDIEKSIVHYGDTTLFFADQLKRYGPNFASAVAMEEVTLIDFNRTAKGDKLVAIYPKEGTFYSDNPLMILNAPWVSADQKEAAKSFSEWVVGQVGAEEAAKYGFRPAEGEPKLESPGINLKEPRIVLGLPEPKVLSRIKTAWREDRKPANVMLVVDTSGSMSEENKLDHAKEGLLTFLKHLSPRDRVGLIAFSDRVYPLEPLNRFKDNRSKLENSIKELIPDGQTSLYQGTIAGLEAVRKLNDHESINAVVVLSDGADTSGTYADLTPLLNRFRDQASVEGTGVRIFTIAYGSGARKDILEKLAEASRGDGFEGDTGDIEKVYLSISSFF